MRYQEFIQYNPGLEEQDRDFAFDCYLEFCEMFGFIPADSELLENDLVNDLFATCQYINNEPIDTEFND